MLLNTSIVTFIQIKYIEFDNRACNGILSMYLLYRFAISRFQNCVSVGLLISSNVFVRIRLNSVILIVFILVDSSINADDRKNRDQLSK